MYSLFCNRFVANSVKICQIKCFLINNIGLNSLLINNNLKNNAKTLNQIRETQKRYLRTTSHSKYKIQNYSPYDYFDGFVYKIRRKIGLKAIPKYRLSESSVYLYESCTDGIDIEKFFHFCKLPDTYLSWFLVTQLHVWMCMTRAMIDGKEGRTMRNEIVARMWDDSDARLKKLTHMPASDRRNGLEDLLQQFQATIFSYDEGLLTDDRTLASALWRVLFIYESVDPHVLETMVSYVRTQVHHLTTIETEKFLLDGKIVWKEFYPLYP